MLYVEVRNWRLIHKQVSFMEIYIKLCIISGMIDYVSGYPFYYVIMGSTYVAKEALS